MSQLTISELQDLLTDIQRQHGNLPVSINDADTAWMYKMSKKHLSVEDCVDQKRLVISIEYTDEQDVA